MKILCISDQIDPLVYSPSVKERFSDVDIILSAGDIPLDYLDFIVSSLNKPMFFVFGNHHTNDLKYYKKLRDTPLLSVKTQFLGCGAVHLGTKIAKEGNMLIAGLGGCMRYNDGPNQFSEYQMFLEIIKLMPRLLWNRIVHGRYIDILLTHAPPRGIHDCEDNCHRGFKSFIWFMNKFKPKYLVHGHIHLYDLSSVRCTKWKNTHVINACGHYVINEQ